MPGQDRHVMIWLGIVTLLCSVWSPGAAAQELSPRTFWPAPVGTKALILGAQQVSGDVLLDPSVPLHDGSSTINSGFLGYMHFFDLWGRTSNLLLEMPYSWGVAKGVLGDTPVHRDFSGLSDAGVTLTVNLIGAPAMTPSGFQMLRANPRPILGLSLKVLMPTGQYDDDRLVNVGGNRWATRVKLGAILPLRPKWLLELEGGAWFFGDDEDFVAGKREQDPIYAFEAHLIRDFTPRLWASLNANFFVGGRQTIGGIEHVDVQRNRRFGVTLVAPFGGRNAFKFGYSLGTRTRYGSDFSQFLVVYQRVLR